MSFWATLFSAGIGALLSSLLVKLLDHFVVISSVLEKQRDADLEIIRKYALDVNSLAKDYWSVDDDDHSTHLVGGTISAKAFFLGRIVERLFEADASLKAAVEIELNRLDSAITSGEFGVKGRSADIRKISGIEICTYTFVDKSELCRRKLKKHFVLFR
ncbi:hypothetical protein [Celeribacter baekdonensis]|uniref:hypothetical protein n=1 Tax=Celeribacter baekdonensis TaxID=875171 RepID=UPI0030DC83CC